jgi:hypothetical protein
MSRASIESNIMNHHRALIGVALVAVLGAARAQDLSTSPDVVHGTVDGHAYRNGGVGRDEVIAMSRRLSRYTLRIALSEGVRGAYLADVKLGVFDAAGHRVFALAEAGPLVDISLPTGRYRVVGEAGGIQRGGTVDVDSGRLAELELHWSKDPEAL